MPTIGAGELHPGSGVRHFCGEVFNLWRSFSRNTRQCEGLDLGKGADASFHPQR